MASLEDDLIAGVDGDERAERLARILDRNAELSKAEQERAARIKLESDRRAKIGHARSLLREYEAAGVAPPFTTEEGVPTVSLSMLLMIGWSVDVFGGVATLHRPEA